MKKLMLAVAALSLLGSLAPTASQAQNCSRLRWACEHKDELGLEGAGTCRRYREACSGGHEENRCAKLRWTCEHKDELGLEGAGTCQRYREACGGYY
ncbi:hypothetical protein SAMN06265338_101892 [Rhodoblastus acidophilus]|uniref:Uncharacterized protein n=1 Tax=Rhodoblastus acidophilus TaxID=1074 RepID=A0A212QMW9_RHOAC|nr:hypothetical protein [Rhodoblastus acidophilus]MCW2317801.1 hypothetical protein [Rhodoblastus acidophilus]PPQ38895.1 hypothetical protein CKO16_08100 [Rhodoblastus acidophilus]RAI20814.1 hypothetical protein CH337_08785 [Rhodoblastus acidophilus]SNB60704.1 hypothetical protein SAMN06265338_101892 [Rhodoblastus acidophilus]